MSTYIRNYGILAGWVTLAILAGEAKAPAASPLAAAKPVTVAVVDGRAITLADVDGLIRDGGPSAVPLPAAQRRQMRMEALAMMIDDLLLQKYLREKGPRVEPAEVVKRLAEMEEGLKRQGKTLAHYYRETGQTEAELRDAQTIMLQWAAYVKARVTEADLKRCFDENKDVFENARVRASHIVIRLPASASDAERTAARQKLLALRQEIITNKLDFAAAATKHSQCQSASTGGDIGAFPRKFVMDEPIAKAAFALQVGQISDIVQTEHGLHLIKVTERIPGQAVDFQKLKEDVRAFCAEELRQSILTDMRRTTKVEINLP